MKNIILHCSASKWGNAAAVTNWHLERGWKTIGYHFIILNGLITPSMDMPEFDGTIETGRGIDEAGAHTKGYNENIGICLIGNSGQFTSKQIQACHKLIGLLQREYGAGKIKQHSDYDPIDKPYCAGFNKEIMSKFNERIS